MSSTRLQQLLGFLEKSPGDSFITFALAKEYESLNEKEKALAHYLSIEQNEPNYVGTYYHLGKLLEQLERFEEAFAAYKRGMLIAKSIGDQHAYSELAGAKLNLGDDEDFE